MKWMSSFAVFFHLLILQLGIQAEPSPISFMNIIPNLLANVRFVQENLEFNQTLPWIDLDLNFIANQSNCSQDIQLLSRDVRARQIWALKTMDAWGKIPSGIIQGNVYWIGSPYECKHRLRGLNNSVVEQPFWTRTCVIGKGYSNSMPLVYGLCVPQSCSTDDVRNYINERVIRIPYIRQWINLTNDSVQCIDRRSYDAKAILTIVILSLIALFILLATGLHIAYGHRHDIKLLEPVPTGYEAISTRTTETETTTTTSTVTTTTVNTALPAEDETVPLIARPTPAVDSAAQRLIGSCSLINNYHLLKFEYEARSLAFLSGIRVLSFCWVILGHTVLYAATYSDNVVSIFNYLRRFWFQIILNGTFSIDTFFLLSGLLTAFLFFISRVENERFSIGRFLLNHYVYRYLRYTIFYAIILLIYITLSPYLGQGGPVYPIDGSESSTCRRTWWRNLLYINNLFDSHDGCVPITWFLAVNMQFHWIAPLFLLVAYWKWILGMLVITIFILIDIISTSVIVSTNDYDHGILSDFHKINGTNITHNYMTDVYIKPWCRIIPYAVGLALGHALYELYQRSNTLTWESILPRRRLTRFNRLHQIFAWLFAVLILSLCVFGIYGDYNDRPLTRSGRITFLVLSRLGWSVGLSIVIITCFLGQGGIVNRLLSHRIFRALSKLTYGAYLWHSLVLFVNYLGRDQPVHYTMANILFNTIVHITISYILSFFTYLFIELPVIQLLKLGFKRRIILQN